MEVTSVIFNFLAATFEKKKIDGINNILLHYIQNILFQHVVNFKNNDLLPLFFKSTVFVLYLLAYLNSN